MTCRECEAGAGILASMSEPADVPPTDEVLAIVRDRAAQLRASGLLPDDLGRTMTNHFDDIMRRARPGRAPDDPLFDALDRLRAALDEPWAGPTPDSARPSVRSLGRRRVEPQQLMDEPWRRIAEASVHVMSVLAQRLHTAEGLLHEARMLVDRVEVLELGAQ